MIVCVQDRLPALLDADDFRHFSLRLVGDDAAEALQASGTGRLIGGSEAFVSVQAVRRLADRGADPSWNEGFSAMLRYAQEHGWLSADGSEIRAHLEADR